MAFCRKAISWANVDLDLCLNMASLDHNEFLVTIVSTYNRDKKLIGVF